MAVLEYHYRRDGLWYRDERGWAMRNESIVLEKLGAEGVPPEEVLRELERMFVVSWKKEYNKINHSKLAQFTKEVIPPCFIKW